MTTFRKTTTGFGALALIATLHPASPTVAAEESLKSSTDRVLGDSRITESSGIARSRRGTGAIFTHNDSGDGPRVFAVGRGGKTRAVLTLKGASAYDWEDIAAGPNHKLWVGDIGDNARRRGEVQVYRFREPKKLRTRTVKQTSFNLKYPDGSQNAEALLVNPRSGRLFIVSKTKGGGAIYRAPKKLSPSGVNRMTRVASAPSTITGGDFSPNGKRIVLRSYGRAYLYKKIGGRGISVRPPSQRQSESITFTARSKRLLIGTEGRSSHVLRVNIPG